MSLWNITYSEFIRRMKILGYEKYREGKGSHEIRIHKITSKEYVVPKHQGSLSKLVIKNLLIIEKLSIKDFTDL